MAAWLRGPSAALRRILATEPAFAADERERLEHERVAANNGRAAAVLPVIAAVQVALLAVYVPRAGAPLADYHAGIFWIHALTLPLTATLGAVAWFGRRRWKLAWLGDAALLIAATLGVALSLNSHRFRPNLNGVTAALFVGALVFRPSRAGAALAYGGALAGLWLGLGAVEHNAEVRLGHVTTGSALVALAFVFSRALDAAFRREVRQRVTIARQQDELRAWNAELERRVEEKVREALAHAAEARALDAQLRVRVLDRSRELARALRDAVAPGSEIVPGSTFEQRYEVERLLGAGAWGEVYAVRDQASGQRAALKVLRRAEGMHPAVAGRFVAEAAAAAAVVHPAIVRTLHVDVAAAGQLYLVMELVEGRTLAAELARGVYDAGQTARLGAVVAGALSAAHAAGVVHRDVKPANLIVTAAPPGVRVLDFGVSKVMDGDPAHATSAGQIVGTPLYMAPEQILAASTVTGACDVYALGLVLCEMLTGSPATGAKDTSEVILDRLVDAPLALQLRGGGVAVPEELEALIQRCVERAPEHRPSAGELALALAALADALGAPPLHEVGPPRVARTAWLAHAETARAE